MSIVSHDLARGYTGAVWQLLPTTGYALNVVARAQLSIFNSFTINKLDASAEYRKLYVEEARKFQTNKPPKGYEWLFIRRQTKRKSKLTTLYRYKDQPRNKAGCTL